MSPATAIGHWAADAGSLRHGIAAHDGRQGDESLHHVVVDAAQRKKGGSADDDAEGDAAAGLLGEEAEHGRGGEVALSRRRREQDGEHDDADAVVEQAFGGDRRLDGRRQHGAAKDRDDRHRVGGADKCAEHQAPDEGHVGAGEEQQALEPEADDQGRQHGADARQDEDRQAPTPHVVQVDAESAGEQQERQHAVEQGAAEVQAVDELPGVMNKAELRKEAADKDDRCRQDGAGDRQADHLRQFDETRIERARRGGEHHDDRRGVEG